MLILMLAALRESSSGKQLKPNTPEFHWLLWGLEPGAACCEWIHTEPQVSLAACLRPMFLAADSIV